MIATEISPRPKSVSRNAWQADNEDALELRGADEPNSFETSTNIASDCFSIAKKLGRLRSHASSTRSVCLR